MAITITIENDTVIGINSTHAKGKQCRSNYPAITADRASAAALENGVDIRKALAAALKNCGNMRKFSKELGISQCMMNKYINGTDLRLSTLLKILDALNLRIKLEPNN